MNSLRSSVLVIYFQTLINQIVTISFKHSIGLYPFNRPTDLPIPTPITSTLDLKLLYSYQHLSVRTNMTRKKNTISVPFIKGAWKQNFKRKVTWEVGGQMQVDDHKHHTPWPHRPPRPRPHTPIPPIRSSDLAASGCGWPRQAYDTAGRASVWQDRRCTGD